MKYQLVLMRLSLHPPNEMLAYSDAHVFASSLIKCWLILMRFTSHAPNEMLAYLRMGCWELWCGVVLFSIFVTK